MLDLVASGLALRAGKLTADATHHRADQKEAASRQAASRNNSTSQTFRQCQDAPDLPSNPGIDAGGDLGTIDLNHGVARQLGVLELFHEGRFHRIDGPVGLAPGRPSEIVTCVDIVASIRTVGIERPIRSVGEPIRVIVIAGFVLAKDHLPQCGVKVGVNGVERWLRGGVRTLEALVMVIRVLMIDDLADGLAEI